MKVKKTRKTLALTLVTVLLGSFMNLSIASAETLDKSLPQTSKTESTIKVSETNIGSNNSAAVIQINDGQTVKVPLKKSPTKTTGVPSTNSTSATLPENGYVTFSRAGNVISYTIVIYDFYTNIVGTASVTDRTSGLSGGTYPVITSTGSVTSNGLSGHYCVLTVSGVATVLGDPVDSFYAQAGWTN